jgi:hypothetical protein
MAVQTVSEHMSAAGVQLHTDAAFRDWLSAMYADPAVGVRAAWPSGLNEAGEHVVTITVYPKVRN